MDERERWNRRYRESDTPGFTPSFVLQSYQHLLPERGRAVDLACGSGGNALLLARHGLETEAWDISDEALALLQQEARHRQLIVTTRAVDIQADALPTESYDVICISHFLDRDLCPAIIQALKPGGLLFYQTFTRERVSDQGPGNPDYRLARNELLHLFQGLQLLAYREEGVTGDTQLGWRDRALLVAQKL